MPGCRLGAAAPPKDHDAAQSHCPHAVNSGHEDSDGFHIPAPKRKKLPESGSRSRIFTRLDKPPSPPKAVAGGSSASPTPAKSRRVRTGCLTCRERHLKCDEGTPDCNNCKKSSRECKRGVRLNFIDTTCKEPPYLMSSDGWPGMSFLRTNYTCAIKYTDILHSCWVRRRIAKYCF